MSAAKHWFRVELDGNGKLISCAVVAEPADPAHGLFFFKATTSERASRLAYNAHHTKLLNARRAQYAKEGRCRCGRLRDRKDGPRCMVCIQRQSADNARRALRKKGIKVPKPDRRESIAARRNEEREAVRLETLRQAPTVEIADLLLDLLAEVSRAWVHARNNKEFTEWLKTKRESITGKRAA